MQISLSRESGLYGRVGNANIISPQHQRYNTIARQTRNSPNMTGLLQSPLPTITVLFQFNQVEMHPAIPYPLDSPMTAI